MLLSSRNDSLAVDVDLFLFPRTVSQTADIGHKMILLAEVLLAQVLPLSVEATLELDFRNSLSMFRYTRTGPLYRQQACGIPRNLLALYSCCGMDVVYLKHT